MSGVKPIVSPLETTCPLTLLFGTSPFDTFEDHSVVESLSYQCPNHLDIIYSVNKLSLHQPTTDHLISVKCLLHCLCITHDHGILLQRQSSLSLHAFSDNDLTNDRDGYNCTSAYIVYMDWNLSRRYRKKQRTIARSSIEAK